MKKRHINVLAKTATFILIILGLLMFSFRNFKDTNNSFNSHKSIVEIKLPSIVPFSSPTAAAQKVDALKATDKNKLPKGVSEAWYSTVMENITAGNYEIRPDEKEINWQAFNPEHNLLFTFTNNGFSAGPLETKIPINSSFNKPYEKTEYKTIENWAISIKTMGFGREALVKLFSGKDFISEKNKAYIEDDNLKICYLNDENGMRQDFIIKNRPEGDGNLRVGLAIETQLMTNISKEQISFRSTTEEKMTYNGLRVTDAKGKELDAWFEKNTNDEKSAYIVLNDSNAEYPITIDPISTTPAWKVESNKPGAGLGASVSSAGDVNHDGYDDVIVGAPVYTSTAYQEGVAFLYLGSSSGLSTTPAWTKGSGQGVSQFGASVACAGDVNHDGYSDVIIGAPNYHNPDDNEGAAFVFYGSSSGLPSTANWVAEGNQADAWFGSSVASAKDVNGDGYDDVIVGAFAFDNPDADEGKAFVYYGSSAGLSTTPAWTAEGNQAGAYFGCCVASAGDVNNDGFDDVIIGAYTYDNPEVDEGKAFVYYGSASGLSATASWTAESNQAGAYFGASVASAGDVNNDGFGDVIISAYSWDGAQANISKVFVYYGSSAGLPANANWTQEGFQTQSQFGYCVASAGDVNGDGYSDIIIGCRLYDDGQTDEGAAFIYYGSSAGIFTPYKWRGESNLANAFMGKSVASAGDVNGDGFDDVIVGAAGYSNGQSNEGAAYVYLGVNDPLPVELTSFTAQIVNGQIHLNWTTATEVNNYGFEIERKNAQYGISNSGWENIGFVKGHGNSNSPKEYSFEDKSITSGKYAYRLKQIDNDGTTDYSDIVTVNLEKSLTEYSLLNNYPNPFNPYTKITYTILNDSKVKLSVYNMLGEKIALLVDEQQTAGGHEAVWNAGNISSGIYIYTLESASIDGKSSFKSVKKMVYMK